MHTIGTNYQSRTTGHRLSRFTRSREIQRPCINQSMASPLSEIPEDVLHLIIDGLVSSTDRRGLVSTAWSGLRRLLHFSDGFEAARRARHSVSADRARFRAVCRSWHLAMRQHVPAPRQIPWIVMSDGSFLTPSDVAGTSPARIPSLPRNARCVASADSWLLLDRTDVRKKMHSYFLHDPFTNTTVPLPELDAVIGHASELFGVHKLRKGVWLPKPQTAPFIYIVDTAFLGDKLYGITHAEDLVSFEEVANNEEQSKEDTIEQRRKKTGDDMILEGITAWSDDEDEVRDHWYLVESCGKLLMVIRQVRVPSYNISSTLKVEVYEADACKGAHCWVPIVGGLGSQTLFISRFFCKSISTCDEADQDAIHFIDTGEKYNMKSQTMSKSWRDIEYFESMWIFSPELVV
ncbi:hypothetical protein VPH35_038274 [Triticum aestivum]